MVKRKICESCRKLFPRGELKRVGRIGLVCEKCRKGNSYEED